MNGEYIGNRRRGTKKEKGRSWDVSQNQVLSGTQSWKRRTKKLTPCLDSADSKFCIKSLVFPDFCNSQQRRKIRRNINREIKRKKMKYKSKNILLLNLVILRYYIDD